MKKIIAVILAMTIALSSSVFGFAASGEIDYENAIVLEPIVRVNPHYADVISAEDLIFEIDRDYVPKAVPESSYLSNYEEAGGQMREHLEARDTYFEIYYKISDPSLSLQVICENIIANALVHTGEPTEGDYIQWHYAGWKAGASRYEKGDYIYYTLKFQFAYYTTAEQEAELTEEVNRVRDELDIEDKNDYLKIKAIYDYICDNITYDYYNLGNDSYDLKYTAYAALINKTAVCQGYANLFYRMALQMGVDARFISGDAGGAHGWNIVQMGDYYYNLDSTWDAGRYFYRYFLVCPENFEDHIRDEEYDTAQFHAAYPMGASDYVYNESDFEEEKASVDINGDGETDVLDVYYLRLVAAKLISVSAEDIEIADVDGDGKLTAIDANILRKYIAGIITELPVA